MTQKILVVDDEKDIRELVSALLEREGFEVKGLPNGFDAVEAVKSGERFSLIIMDIIMPEMNGIDAVKNIRTFSQCPVLFLTAKTSDYDKISAFSAGGDDFLSKPFSSIELVLRVKAILKRYKENENGEHTLVVDAVRKNVVKNGTLIKLTEKEFEVLYLLYTNRGVPFEIHDIYEMIWHEKYTNASANTVMVHILNLRKKLEDDFKNPKLILTEWGKGYLYVEKD